ncbi:MAG: metallophosphoesterase [Magnetococcales bacterium]|nr:metallophosphoesterase [Magnetococcales bacterium]
MANHFSQPLRWLHLSDLHLGSPGKEVWWQTNEDFAVSIQSMVKQRGAAPDLLLLTGDITHQGNPDGYSLFKEFYERLCQWLGNRPVIIPVPGNHDLLRPKSKLAARNLQILDNFAQGDADEFIKELNNDLWNRKDASFFMPLFHHYQQWLQEYIQPAWQSVGIKHLLSFFPGDVRVDIALPYKPPVTVVGLNSAWRHFTDLNPGQLEIYRQQQHQLLVNHDSAAAKLLLLHHPYSWFSPISSTFFQRDIYQPDRYLACLFGHMHEGNATAVAQYGGKPRHYFQAPSLFGLENYGTATEKRSMGYAWGELDGDGCLRIWPMKLHVTTNQEIKFVYDQDCGGGSSTGFLLRQCQPSATPEPTAAAVSPPPISDGQSRIVEARGTSSRHVSVVVYAEAAKKEEPKPLLRDGAAMFIAFKNKLEKLFASAPAALQLCSKKLGKEQAADAQVPLIPVEPLVDGLLALGFPEVKDILLAAQRELAEQDPDAEKVIKKISRLILPWLLVFWRFSPQKPIEWIEQGILANVLPIPAGISSMAELIMAGLDHREVTWQAIHSFPVSKFLIDMEFLPEGGISNSTQKDLEIIRTDLYKRIEIPGNVKTIAEQDRAINTQLEFLFQKGVRYYLICAAMTGDTKSDQRFQARIAAIQQQYPIVALVGLNRDLIDFDQRLFNEIRELLVTEDV